MIHESFDVKILIIAKAYPPETGGIETYSEQLAVAYADLGHDVTVLTAHPGVAGYEKRSEVNIFNVGQGPQWMVFLRMSTWLKKLKFSEYDFIHATTWRVAIPLLLFHSKPKTAVTIHGREVFIVPGLLKPAMAQVLKSANFIPTVSQPILDKVRNLSGLPLPQAFSNWNGISYEDEAKANFPKPSGFNIFCMCRMVERKNVATAITAVAELIDEGFDIRFNVAGGGGDLERLREHAAIVHKGKRIVLHGRMPDDDIPKHYRQAHVFLHPQIATRDGGDLEGFGLTIADGMAFGCVPIAGSSGGPSDFIEDGETGFLVSGGDVDEIKSYIRKLYKSPSLLLQMSNTARQFALDELTWRRHAVAMLDRLPPTLEKT